MKIRLLNFVNNCSKNIRRDIILVSSIFLPFFAFGVYETIKNFRAYILKVTVK